MTTPTAEEPTMTKVEEVARAVGEVLDKTPWEECGSGFKEICTDVARAAIKAMRDPSQAMIDAMDEHAGTIAPQYA